MDINKENLENALNQPGENSSTQQNTNEPQMSKEMEVGFHQGALNTLASERSELYNMIKNVEKIMGMHIQRLEQLGIKVQKQE